MNINKIGLIGTSHPYQTAEERCPPQGAQAFQRFLSEACRRYGIRTVAAEMNAEALAEVKRNESIPQRVAKDLSLKHRFCDPNREERGKLGIFQENYLRIKSFPNPPMPEDEIKRQLLEGDRRREQYWLECLLTEPQVEWPVLFICGADHVKSFERILKDKGFSVECIAEDWSH